MSTGDEETTFDEEKSAWREYEQDYFKNEKKVTISIENSTIHSEYSEVYDMTKQRQKHQLQFYKEDPF